MRSEKFQRVVVRRPASGPIVTDFVACVGCRLMYPAPMLDRSPLPPQHGVGVGGPRPPTDREIEEAAGSCRKPGRSGLLGPGGRK